MEKDFECTSKLIGKNLNGKWKVIEKIKKEPGETGGNFSIGYLVEDASGKVAFLKAIDLQKAFLLLFPLGGANRLQEAPGTRLLAGAYHVIICAGDSLQYIFRL